MQSLTHRSVDATRCLVSTSITRAGIATACTGSPGCPEPPRPVCLQMLELPCGTRPPSPAPVPRPPVRRSIGRRLHFAVIPLSPLSSRTPRPNATGAHRDVDAPVRPSRCYRTAVLAVVGPGPPSTAHTGYRTHCRADTSHTYRTLLPPYLQSATQVPVTASRPNHATELVRQQYDTELCPGRLRSV